MNLIEAVIQAFLSFFGGSASAAPSVMMTIPEKVEDAIRTQIVPALGIPSANVEDAVAALKKQSAIETRNWTVWYFAGANQKDGLPPTYNLMNRHAGSGRGEWTHQTKYVGPGDEDLRIFTDVYQSARDYVELLNDPLYASAKQALIDGDKAGYFQALSDKGFDDHSGNYAAIAAQYRSIA